MNPLIVSRTFKTSLTRFVLVAFAITLGSLAANAQSATDGSTPTGMSPGAPAGSYALTGFENVNLFNGHLNFHLPLLQVGGRGSAGYTINLNLERQWRTRKIGPPIVIYPETGPWGGLEVGYSPGVLLGRVVGAPTGGLCEENEGWRGSLTRLTFVGADGTEYELVDKPTMGVAQQVYYNSDCSIGYNYSRGKVFVTRDGSGVTFNSDDDILDAYGFDINEIWPSGYLLMKDGTRYRIAGGVVTYIQDRNGNRVTLANVGRNITDSLNRAVTVAYYYDSNPHLDYDQISFKGTAGSARTIRIWKSDLSDALRSGFSIQTYLQLFPEMNGSDSSPFNPPVVSSVELPDGRRYWFKYNPYGELARVELPTGGAIEYDYAAGLRSGAASGSYGGGGVYTTKQIYRRVVERRIYKDSSAVYESKMTISRPENSTIETDGYVVVEQRNYAGALLASDKHYFHGTAVVPTYQTPFDYSPWQDGREWKTESLSLTGSVLRAVEHTWANPGGNPQITQSVTTLSDTNQVAKQTFLYDQYNNKTDVYEYAYGTGGSGALVRRTHTDYVTTNVVDGVTVNYDTDLAIHLRSLPKQTSVYDAAGVEQARTTFEYDNYTGATHHYPLVPRSSITGLDAAFTASMKTRGNATMTTRSLLTNGVVTGSIYAYQQYDVAGNTVKAIDDLGNDTELDFSDHFGAPDGNAQLHSSPPELGGLLTYAFPWKVTNAMNHIFYTQRDYYTGLVVDAEDANGVTSSAYYLDPLDRPTKVIKAADEPALQSQTSFSYDDTLRTITTTSDFDVFGDLTPLKSQTLYDGLGRTTETRQYESATTYVTTKQTYDALGRAEKVSNPYRSGETVLWTTTTYDALGRVTSVKTPDNATVTTSYSGNTVTTTDQAGKDRQSTTDALGRLTQVIEDPGTGGLGHVTTYAYDVLANLKTVTQGAQTRTFTYDSLSRLKTAFNPESGTISYAYDDNGNLTQKTDARSIVTTFTYDAINRPTLKNYNDTTPDVAYFYDAQTLPAGAPSFVRGSSTGRLVAVTTGGTSAGTYRGYDAVGQVVRKYQRTDSVNYLVEATYNKAGAMLTETYPAVPGAGDRRIVSYASDAAGRLASLSSVATSYAPASSVTSISYAPHGALASETLGNNLIHAQTYNNRLQPTAIKLGTAALPSSVVNLTYNYGTTTNNGNVQSVSYAGGGLSYTQTFGHDQLNRLTTSQEGASWSQTNSYDRYGNRAIVGSGMTFNATNNRITNAGYTYDLVGNLLTDGAHAYTYNAENKISKVDLVSAYVYDGEGQRVRKLLNENLRFIYGIGGQQIAEFSGANGTLKKEYVYGASGLVATIEPTAVNANGTRYTTSDHLGSPRLVTSSGAGVVSRHDYKPFGEELWSGIGGRTVGMGYGVADGLRQKFTSKERDNETGLDYFLARYSASTQGRFTSPDPFGPWAMSDEERAAFMLTPQQWGRYTYCLNNPLKLIDPTGLEVYDPNVDDEAQKNIHNALVEISKHGTKAQRVRASFILKNNVLIKLVHGDNSGGISNVAAANQRIGQGWTSMGEAASYTQINIDASVAHPNSPERSANLEGILVHEGNHVYDDARTMSSLSSGQGMNSVWDPTIFKTENDAYHQAASYLLKRGGNYHTVGLDTNGIVNGYGKGLLKNDNGKIGVNEERIRDILINAPYRVTKDNPGPTTTQRRGLRP